MRMPRRQHTLERPVTTRGIGFLTGADVTVRFVPLAENSGIYFQRVDLPGTPPVPALLDYVVPRDRRTVLSHGGATIELVEHIMAALAGLQIDNCLVEINAPEAPGCDGSSLQFVQALLEAGIKEQTATRPLLVVEHSLAIAENNDTIALSAGPITRHGMVITYELDYGPRSPIRPQIFSIEITPENFITCLAFARTFVLEAEVNALKAQGYGTRLTEKDLLIFGEDGPIGNTVRVKDECVRHKILDCVGDFALIGCDLHGQFRAFRTGHSHNHRIMRAVRDAHHQEFSEGPLSQRPAPILTTHELHARRTA